MKNYIWRTLSIILVLVWSIVFVVNNYLDVLHNAPSNLVLQHNIINAFPILLSLVLVRYPKNFFVYAVMCCFMGINSLILGSGTNGFLMYVLGCIFLYRISVLFKKKGLTILIGIVPILALASQYRLGVAALFESALDLLFLFVLFTLAYVVLSECFENSWVSTKAKVESVDDPNMVSLACLCEEELDILQDVLNGTTFFAIGMEKNKSESSIKQQMVVIYRKLGIRKKQELIDLHKQGLLKYPKQG